MQPLTDVLPTSREIQTALFNLYAKRRSDPDVLYAHPETLKALARQFYTEAGSRITLTPNPKHPGDVAFVATTLTHIINPATGTAIAFTPDEHLPENVILVDDIHALTTPLSTNTVHVRVNLLQHFL